MRDELHQNYGAMTGTPTLVAGALTDGNQGLLFDGSTNSMSVPDSVSDSLAVADGAAGGMALELFLKFAALPGSLKTIVGKAGSYTLSLRTDGKLEWKLENGANSVTLVSTAALATNQWYHLVGVYNGDYTGTPQFGYTSQGSVQTGIPGDFFKGAATSGSTFNLMGSKFDAPEKGALTGVVMDLQHNGDLALREYLRAVVYEDVAGAPGDRVAQSVDQRLGGPALLTRTWVTFPLAGVIYKQPYWICVEGGETSAIVKIGYESSGGSRAYRRDQRGYDSGDAHPVGDSVTPFGTPGGTDAVKLSLYATYTPTGRTGDEGKALIYINGALDNSSSYAHGIADSANAISFAPSFACSLDDVSIWNKKLTAVQVAQHYSAR